MADHFVTSVPPINVVIGGAPPAQNSANQLTAAELEERNEQRLVRNRLETLEADDDGETAQFSETSNDIGKNKAKKPSLSPVILETEDEFENLDNSSKLGLAYRSRKYWRDFIRKTLREPTLWPLRKRPGLRDRLDPRTWAPTVIPVFLTLIVLTYTSAALNFYVRDFRVHLSLFTCSFASMMILLLELPDVNCSQPRNAFFGQLLSALIGVTCRFLLATSDHVIIGPLSVAASLLAMKLTHSVHPPGGVTALTACCTPGLPAGPEAYCFVVLPVGLGSLWIIFFAWIINNLRPSTQYPQYWL